MSRLTIGVLFGGASSEYEVSLMSASSVLNNIDHNKYDVVMLGITKDGRWLRYTGSIDDIRANRWQESGCTTPAFISPDRSVHGIVEILPDGTVAYTRLDAVFPVMHGKNCEDGTLQGLFTVAGIPFVGCDTLSSAVCMDKVIARTTTDGAGIPSTPWEWFYADALEDFDGLEARLREKLGYPMFIKPANAGSSVGVSRVIDKQGLAEAIRTALVHDRKVVAEQAVVGQEVECAVLGNDTPIASIVGEIAPKTTFYDYNAKYIDDTTDLYVPARISDKTAEDVRDMAVRTYRALCCTGLARVDFFVKKDGTVILNEINTIPGFTHISMYPKLFEAYGIPYPELIDRLITLSLERKFLI